MPPLSLGWLFQEAPLKRFIHIVVAYSYAPLEHYSLNLFHQKQKLIRLSTVRLFLWKAAGVDRLVKAIEDHSPHRLFQDRLRLELKNLTLAFVALIQGLAFSDLASSFVKLIDQFTLGLPE